MSCLSNCSSYDPNYKGGWCNFHGRETSAGDTCSNEDSRGGNNGDSNRSCSNCDDYSNGYCNDLNQYVNSGNVCSKWR